MENITLNDIAGYTDEKKEAQKIINIIKNIDVFEKQGASLPRGMIIYGTCGTGKTMLVKAIANESKAPTFVFDASAEETKAADLRKLFKEAKEHKPSIVVIEEINYLLPDNRYESDSSRSMFKTLLTEIDGVDNTSGIFIIATSNREAFPRALTRSGRLERTMLLDKPDEKERYEILSLYAKKNHYFDNIDLHSVAENCQGFVGADLKNLVNQALINAIAENKEITEADISSLIPQVRFKTAKKKEENQENRNRVAYHEIGHMLCTYFTKQSATSVSIDRYNNVRGYCVEPENDTFQTTDMMFNDMIVALGGLAGEVIGTGKRSSGATSDIKTAYDIANTIMATGEYGWNLVSDALLDDFSNGPLSQDKVKAIDKKRGELFDEAYQKAYQIISTHKEELDELSQMILRSNVLSASTIKNYFEKHGYKTENKPVLSDNPKCSIQA